MSPTTFFLFFFLLSFLTDVGERKLLDLAIVIHAQYSFAPGSSRSAHSELIKSNMSPQGNLCDNILYH